MSLSVPAPATDTGPVAPNEIPPMRLTLSALLLCAALPAHADVFDDASGLWGLTGDDELTCQLNPHRVTFFDDNKRASFRWEHLMTNYLGEPDQEGFYTVLDHGDDYIVLALDGEQRRTLEDAPVVWIMRLSEGGGRYCWGRTDWPAEDCLDGYARCPAPVPIS
ncbi:hypothetical protein [Frigidibacter sp. ROC022]|uniref:hypothetical protein n=1 Tax=Frigidibacter sp. ROC022 TaxID=2971796 RepID=UPI00215AF9EC|nr:hypothetical protein [Frigidibacter sp. ROC022]MCR8724041.1 hypothetical protein [Frigidibacter sp. ROC022]